MSDAVNVLFPQYIRKMKKEEPNVPNYIVIEMFG